MISGDWSWNAFAMMPVFYLSVVAGEIQGWSDPITRLIFAVALASLVAGSILAVIRREAKVLLFLIPLAATNLFLLALYTFPHLFFFFPRVGLILLVLLFPLAEVIAVARIVRASAKSTLAAVLVGSFCLSYAALAVLSVSAGLASI